MKFLLVFQMCYQISHACLPPIDTGIVYDTFRECSLNGYKKAHEMITSLPYEKVENYQTIIKFWCKQKRPIIKKGKAV